jgi:DNA-binding response OmpR family regulator
LIVEDEEHLLRLYMDTLEQAGYLVHGASTGRRALEASAAFRPGLVILDLELEGRMDGFEVLVNLRRDSAMPVMILTGQAGEARLVRGLNLGADNYVLKPVTKAELLARVRSHLRRGGFDEPGTLAPVHDYGRLRIDLSRNQIIHAGGHRFTLRGVEKAILARLLRTPGALVPYQELMQLGWPQSGPRVRWDDSRALMSCVYRLRTKLDLGPAIPGLIETVPGDGYRIALAAEIHALLEGNLSQ